MAVSDADSVVLVHRRKSPMPGVRKTFYGLAPLVGVIVGGVVLALPGQPHRQQHVLFHGQ